MISMKPILEPDVLSLLNKDRFEGSLQGYVITDGKEYLGYCIYIVDGTMVTILDVVVKGTENVVPDYSVLDGAVRAAVNNGNLQGATVFKVLFTTDAMKKWVAVFCKDAGESALIETFFASCQHEH